MSELVSTFVQIVIIGFSIVRRNYRTLVRVNAVTDFPFSIFAEPVQTTSDHVVKAV